MSHIVKKIITVLSGFGAVVILLLLMLLLTFLGTLYQVDHGLFAAQQKYFNSIFLVHYLFGNIPVPLPGGALVMTLFTVNLIVGGILRLRKRWNSPGILITHLGILVMFIGAFVTFSFSKTGNMRLYENQTSNEFLDFYGWDVEIGKPGAGQELLVIPQEQIEDLGPGESRDFFAQSLPFEVTLSAFAKNAAPMPVGPMLASSVKNIDGFFLQKLELAAEAEQNVAGVLVSTKDKATGEITEGILWGLALYPLTVKSGDETYTVSLERKRWQVPFDIHLEDFTRVLHPGTQMAASYESEVLKIEGGTTEKIRIWMNHPLRYKGYTFFQASWGPQNAGPNEPLFSVFQVVQNPADQLPLVSCIIVGVGLLIHFTQSLVRYLRAESKRRAT